MQDKVFGALGWRDLWGLIPALYPNPLEALPCPPRKSWNCVCCASRLSFAVFLAELNTQYSYVNNIMSSNHNFHQQNWSNLTSLWQTLMKLYILKLQAKKTEYILVGLQCNNSVTVVDAKKTRQRLWLRLGVNISVATGGNCPPPNRPRTRSWDSHKSAEKCESSRVGGGGWGGEVVHARAQTRFPATETCCCNWIAGIAWEYCPCVPCTAAVTSAFVVTMSPL